MRVLQRLHLTGTGDYLIVVSAPVLDVQRRSGLAVGARAAARADPLVGLLLEAAPARRRRHACTPGRCAPYLPLRLQARRDGDRYELTVTNTTATSEVAFQGAATAKELAALLDRTRRDSLAHRRLRPAYVTISGLVSQRSEKPMIAAPLRVEGELRFPTAPSAARGATLAGRTVRFSFVLGDGQPLTRRIEVSGGGEPRLRLEARPDNVVRGLTPPGGARQLERGRRAATARRRRAARAPDRHAHAARPL